MGENYHKGKAREITIFLMRGVEKVKKFVFAAMQHVCCC